MDRNFPLVSAIVPETAGKRDDGLGDPHRAISGVLLTWTSKRGRANETGGEILSDKPERLNTTFVDSAKELAHYRQLLVRQVGSVWGANIACRIGAIVTAQISKRHDQKQRRNAERGEHVKQRRAFEINKE